MKDVIRGACTAGVVLASSVLAIVVAAFLLLVVESLLTAVL